MNATVLSQEGTTLTCRPARRPGRNGMGWGYMPTAACTSGGERRARCYEPIKCYRPCPAGSGGRAAGGRALKGGCGSSWSPCVPPLIWPGTRHYLFARAPVRRRRSA